MKTAIRFAVIAPVLLLVGGCVSFGGEVPDGLLTLTPAATAPSGSAVSAGQGNALALVEFEAPAAIDVTRVPVQVSDTELAYLKDAVWVEKPARLFRRLIAETIRARSGRVVIDGDDPGVLATDRLQGTVRAFGYDAQTSEVVVVFDAVRAGNGSSVQTRRFEARVGGVTAKPGSVGPALNEAANKVAAEVAEWVG